MNYTNKIEYIKNEFINFYIDKDSENGILQGMRYSGEDTHCRNCLYTITKMVKPINVLEIGSMHYETSDSIALAMDELYGIGGAGKVDSFDIKVGGYDDKIFKKPKSSRVSQNYWYPHNSDYNMWKYSDNDIIYKDFVKYNNNEITEKNIQILKNISNEHNNIYDLIFIYGHHSYEGVKKDFELALKFSDKNTLIVLDNVWDQRFIGVREFYNDLKTIKWNFLEWNDTYYQKNMVQDIAITLTY